MLFGAVNPNMDRYLKIEGVIQKDLDAWLTNLYFEIEKVNLTDIKVETKTDRLFYRPVVGVSPQEQQQMLKMHAHDDADFAMGEDSLLLDGEEELKIPPHGPGAND